MDLEAIVVPALFFGSVFGFPLLRRQMIHRHELEREALRRGLLPARVTQEHPALPAPLAPAVVGDDAPILALRLPEPHRLFALALLCRLEDTPPPAEERSRTMLSQIRLEYLPETLRAYLHLTPAGREQLRAQGRDPEGLLREQLERLNEGLDDLLRHDHAAADRLLTQGHFLRDRFGAPHTELLRSR